MSFVKKGALALLILTALLAVCAAAVYFIFPGKLVELTQWATANSSGLTRKSINIDGYQVSYYEGGQGDAVVLLHGMADEKNSFAAAAKELTGQFHVILPDLPGHGENVRDPARDYSIRGHAVFLEKFVDKLGLKSFSLGGNSMGGHVSAAYTLAHPQQVRKLILVNAPGLTLDDHVVYAGFGKKMETPEDFYAVMDRVLHKRPTLPGPIVQHMIAQTNNSIGFINGLADAVKAGQDFDLKDRVATIAAPTLILWGKHDKVVKFNVAQAYDERIPNSQLVILEDASHSPQLEIPEAVGKAISNFLK
jgi:abhydrolase domain-containing protein 6